MISKYSKALIITALPAVLLFFSCDNQPVLTERASIKVTTYRINHSQAQIVSDSVMAIIQALFEKNNLSLNNRQPYALSSNPGRPVVKCYQFYKGLEIFYQELNYHFDSSGVYDTTTGNLVVDIALDTTPKVTPDIAGALFDDQIVSDQFNSYSLGSFRSQGYNAELGFYDLNLGRGIDVVKFTMAWKMTVAGGAKYPVGYIGADSAFVIYYDNGLRF